MSSSRPGPFLGTPCARWLKSMPFPSGEKCLMSPRSQEAWPERTWSRTSVLTMGVSVKRPLLLPTGGEMSARSR